jgi:pentatricopeptide repeat protein
LYCAVVDACVKSNHPEAIQRAQAVVEEMEASPLPDVFPDTNVLSCILHGLALRSDQEGSVSRALGILRSMILHYEQDNNTPKKPNQQCFCNVITAFARSGQAQQAQDVLDDMQALYERTHDPDFRPDAWSYTSVLDAWAKQGNIDQTKVVIRRMQEIAETTGDSSLNATNVNMNALLHAMAREQKLKRGRRGEDDLVERAQAILKTMEDLYHNENRIEMKPDVISYGAVIDCFAKSNRSDAAEQCEALLRRMQEKARAGDLDMRPNSIVFSTVVNAWSRSKKPEAP